MAGGEGLIAAVSIGRNPTFDGQALAVEAFLLDYAGELRGREMRLELAEWVRAQRRFETPAALVEQIGRDVEQIRSAMSSVDRRPAAPVGE
jgi:riboflavin kinase/FMN adenylyltransferase